MNRRVVSLLWMLFFAAVASRATTLTFKPATPQSTDTVEITVITGGCIPFLATEVLAAKEGANGLIRIDIHDDSVCVATPPPHGPLKAEVGPLPSGTYTTELYWTYPEEPSTLLQTGQLVVSSSGQIGALRTEPRQPRAGQRVFAVVGTYCPVAWRLAGTTIEGLQRVFVLQEDFPFPPPPSSECSSTPSFEHRVDLGPLDAGTYRLRVTPPQATPLPPPPLAEHVFTVALPGPGLFLQDNRFRVRATWDSSEHGPSEAQAVQLTRDSGYFWFFHQDNVELVAKVLNGCGVNNHYWVFLAGLTNISVTVTVDDSVTGETRTYTNALGQPFLPVQDTKAFEGCSQ